MDNNKLSRLLILMGILLAVITMTSCGDHSTSSMTTNSPNDGHDMNVTKFQYEGNYYIQFEFKYIQGGGITLDPDYLFVGYTIVHDGQKYIKLK